MGIACDDVLVTIDGGWYFCTTRRILILLDDNLVGQLFLLHDIRVMEFMTANDVISDSHPAIAEMEMGILHSGSERENIAHRQTVNIVGEIHESTTLCIDPSTLFRKCFDAFTHRAVG